MDRRNVREATLHNHAFQPISTRKENAVNDCSTSENQTTRRIRLIAGAVGLAVAFAVWLPQPARADVTPPTVPTEIEVLPGNKAFLEGHAVGTQNYICLPSGSHFAWTLFTPQATLFDDDDQQVTTHFFSPNPLEKGSTVRATWEHSLDTSIVWGQVIQPVSVAPDAIPWLLIEAVGVQDGPTGGNTLSATTFIQRVNTEGGVAPSTGCSKTKDLGAKAFVPYKADYIFYMADGT